MATWPLTLPTKPIRDGFQAQDQDSVNRFEPTYGEPLIRLGSTATPVLQQVSFIITEAQRDILMAFYRTDCAHGSLEFTFNDPETEVSSTFIFLSSPLREGLGGDNWRIRFGLMKLP